MRQCICHICSCGRHRCERKADRVVPYAEEDTCLLTTEHKERYRLFELQPHQQYIKPAGLSTWKGYDLTGELSMAKKEFDDRFLQKTSFIYKKNSASPESNYLALITTYQHDYGPKIAIRTEKAKISDSKGRDGIILGPFPGKMEGVSTYNRSYTPKPFQKLEKAIGKELTLTQLDFKGNN